MCKKIYQKGPQHACSTYFFKHLLQLWEPQEQVIKVPFKTNNSLFYKDGFISTSNSEQKEQTNKEKYAFYYSVSQIHINSEKT